jgi:hypothetical protein
LFDDTYHAGDGGREAKLRAAFGESVDEAATCGKYGEPSFHALENGRNGGSPDTDHQNAWEASNDMRDRQLRRI